VAQLACADGYPPVRLSIRRAGPNFEIQWRLRQVRPKSSTDIAESVRRLTEAL
jgi:hypothetical protein